MIFAFAALAVALALQPSQAPQEKRATKGHSAQSASESEHSSNPKEPPTPASAPITSQPSPQPSKAGENHDAGQVDIQRNIEIFTGVLAGVGVFQLVVMFLTLLVYRRQAGIMARQTDLMEGGLSVDPPRMIDFEDGKRPSVFVKIVNSGIVPAKDVSVCLKFEIGDHTNFSSAQVITIRAGKGRKCFIPSNVALRIGDVLAIQSGEMVLRVIITLTQPKKPKKKEEIHCYKFYPWLPSDTRPKGLPQFVECDFDVKTSTSAIAKPAGVSAVATLGNATAKADNPPPETTEKPGDPN